MAATPKLFVVDNGSDIRLIEATSKAKALRFAVNTSVTAKLATQHEIAALVREGMVVESALDAAGDNITE